MPQRPPGADQYLIVTSELQAAREGNLYDAVRRLRPDWFTRTSRSSRRNTTESSINVYYEDRILGGIPSLTRFAANYPTRVRYMSPTEAQVKFGIKNEMRAAIVIEVDR